MRVHLGHTFDARAVLEDALDSAILLSDGDEVPSGTQVLVNGRPSASDLDTPGLEGVIVPWSGVWPAVRERVLERPHLRVHNLHHNAALVAEHAVALALACIRRVVPMHQTFAQADWRPRYADDPSPSIEGSTAVIVGYGAIGQRIARVLHALGMDVHATSRRGTGPGPATVHPAEDLDALLPGATLVVLAAPHTPQTHHLFDADRLALCSRLCSLVNIGRAELCDEAALYEALAGERLFGAGLDVWWRYPKGEAARVGTPPAEHPFHELPNVVLSPHRAGHGLDTERLRMEHLAVSLNAWARGESVPNPVNLQAGY